MTRWTRRLAPSASLDQNVRTALWVLALVSVAGTLVAVLSAGLRPTGLATALAALAWLAVHWGRSRRVLEARWTGDVLDALAIAAVVVALPGSNQVLTLPTAGVLLRSVRPGWALAAARLGLYCLAIAAGPLVARLGEGRLALAQAGVDVLSALSGLVFATVFVLPLGSALVRTERGAERDRVLAGGGVRLISASTAEEVLADAQQVADVLASSVRGVQVRVVARRPRGRGPSQAADGQEVYLAPLGAREEDGWLEVRGPRRATVEVVPALTVLGQQASLALAKCQALEELRERAETDGLTGLVSAETFRERLRALVASAADHGVGADEQEDHGTLLVVDCDDFKAVNDTYGHLAGDAVLREVAQRLRADSRAGDVVARLGGDEFAVLLGPAADGATSARVDRLTALLSQPVVAGGHEVAISCSVGSTLVHAGRSLEELVRAADSAMYTAKAAGKGRHVTSEVGAAHESAVSTATGTATSTAGAPSDHLGVIRDPAEHLVVAEP